MSQFSTNSTSKQDFTDTDAFPAFTDKDDLLTAILDIANNGNDVYDLAARVANTDLSGISNPTMTLAQASDLGRG